jgi:glycosyltransferase involved in cell wall biosynthesis
MVSLSVILPTPGQGRPLKRALRSIASQPLHPGDEVLVVGDCVDDPHPDTGLADVRALVADFGAQYRFLYTLPAAHDWGHTQINVGMTVAMGDYLVYQDDDDVFVEGAFDAIRAAAEAHPGAPLMFRFVTRFRTLLWATKEIREEWVGGHSFVVPNLKARLAPWTPRYQGDYDHIRGTVDNWPGKDAAVVWREEVIAFARPEAPG